MPGLIIAAPSSGAGKTTFTLGLLRALSHRGLPVVSAKSGPDYIDPRFHAAATGADCINLDAWAMSPVRLRALAATDQTLIVEGAMGLFDGAVDGTGSTADLARILGLPVLLVLDASRTGQSIAAVVQGFAQFDPAVRIAGVICNNVGSDRHADILRRALTPTGLPLLGLLPRQPDLRQPSRHLGLVQATEHPDLDRVLNTAADWIGQHVDLDTLLALPAALPDKSQAPRIPPPAQTIAIAQDEAFAFHYPHMIADWRTQGAAITWFSPLADDPVPQADFIFLPGGYPELHAGRLTANSTFLTTLRGSPATIYGECGGYMVLGDGLIDADGKRHQMAGLLPLDTSFATRKRHLGYRRLTATSGPFRGEWTGHEFHYATTLRAEGTPLFQATDATGTPLPAMGLTQGRISGSFAHIIDRD